MNAYPNDAEVTARRNEYGIREGERYTFAYPTQFTSLPDYSAHRGQPVLVLRELAEADVDIENAPMYRVRAEDGWEGDAWPDELTPVTGR